MVSRFERIGDVKGCEICGEVAEAETHDRRCPKCDGKLQVLYDCPVCHMPFGLDYLTNDHYPGHFEGYYTREVGVGGSQSSE